MHSISCTNLSKIEIHRLIIKLINDIIKIKIDKIGRVSILISKKEYFLH